ncbi:hypothetical protein O6H91_02G143500 [Diphasiastrum complanatum]|uniref:Uncharacterized protein n=3 Tax=Diphasiastrum complanatum TaxID=34168 RepID=A0ACC2ELT5_DIPCM|nr:hypothetical protein O6H91_02G140300 [Diphasiastrum complanatum]KAJ7567353.1 hypothetical protein O6H91_02G143400 [Diphasiastrum complanatum]KAJ7567354.1 hypothetical protein O6H91_02G143500 [Diphasiastrum complanatum]
MVTNLNKIAVLLIILVVVTVGAQAITGTGAHRSSVKFQDSYNVTWSPAYVNLLNEGLTVQLLLNQSSGSGFVSCNKYVFGYFSMQIKLPGNDSAGTVTTYYLSSDELTNKHDELDFEFLGNRSGQPYIVQTNVFAQGIGGREQRIYLWFDPSADFHSYSFLWNQNTIIFLVDDVPIRIFKNNTSLGIPYPSSQPMRLYGSLWNGEDWATRGGLEKTNWTQAPFVASYRNFLVDSSSIASQNSSLHDLWWNRSRFQALNKNQTVKLRWVYQNYLVYDYCTDRARYPVFPSECAVNM